MLTRDAVESMAVHIPVDVLNLHRELLTALIHADELDKLNDEECACGLPLSKDHRQGVLQELQDISNIWNALLWDFCHDAIEQLSEIDIPDLTPNSFHELDLDHEGAPVEE